MNEARQKVFEKAYRYHVIDGKPFGWDGITCTYTAGCAIGCQVPLSLAKRMDTVAWLPPDLHSGPSSTFRELNSAIREVLGDVDAEFLRSLQQAHDHAASDMEYRPFSIRDVAYRLGPDIEENYRAVAKAYALEVPRE